MAEEFPRIKHPELFIGFVAPIGAEIKSSLEAFRVSLSARGYKVVEIKLTDVFRLISNFTPPKTPLDSSSLDRRYETFIAYGNQLRAEFGNSAMGTSAIARIARKRLRLPGDEPYTKTAYLIHQFKRKEEVAVLRAVYGELFFQVSVYSRRGARIDHLTKFFARSRNIIDVKPMQAKAEQLVEVDENEAGEKNGQQVGKIFHDADFIVSIDQTQPMVRDQIERFCSLIFSANFIAPTRIEDGMFLAKAAALRTLDLSRQVGAAIFTEEGDIVALGSNEVPKAGGGAYRSDDTSDGREHKLRVDSNEMQKRAVLNEITTLLGVETSVTSLLARDDIKASQLMNALEYGRVVHAEMAAIIDAARSSRSTQGNTLYCTTFPCHMCAKHIVAAGIKEVVFLEPYPKSLAANLHPDSIQVEKGDRGSFSEFTQVRFEHFFGVTPRRYRELFERGKRKDTSGNFVDYGSDGPEFVLDIRFPSYHIFESLYAARSGKRFREAAEECEVG